VFVVCSL